MKKVLATLGVVLMMGLVCVSCKKDDETNYPTALTSGVWSGGNSSTGYNCDVTISANNAMPGSNYIALTISSPDKEEKTGIFQGAYTYDATKGTITVQLDATDGGPSSATLQFNSHANALSVSFTAANVDYGTYTVTKVTFPRSIAGDWMYSETTGMAVKAYLAPYAVDGGLPCSVSVMLGATTMEFTGTYTYDVKTGKGEFTVTTTAMPDAVQGTFTYNTDGALSCAVPGLLPDAVKLARGK